MATTTYSTTFEAVNVVYGPLAMAKLRELIAPFEAAGFVTTEPQDISADEYQWTLGVWFDAEKVRGADVTISVEEERAHDGGDGFGLNFVMEVCDSDGMMIGAYQPHNYSEFVWVDARNSELVKERWNEFAQITAGTIIHAIEGRREHG